MSSLAQQPRDSQVQSQLQASANETPDLPPPETYLLTPEELAELWDHANPRQYFSEKLRKHIEAEDEKMKEET